MKKVIYILILIFFIIGNVYAFYEEASSEEDYIVETTGSLDVPNLNAKSAILYDMTYDRILYEKNSKQRRANASTTKMITALVAYEKGNLNDIVTISQKVGNTGGSTINLRTGDKISLDNLIKGLLVHSGNDAAVAIAEHISGSIEEFAILMNEKAEEIGAKDSHFVNPHGLDAENHYSTAFDLMLIAKEVLNTPYLANIVSKRTIEIEINGNTRTIGTTNEVLSAYPGANGVKTGFTGDAGRCIVTSAKKDNRQIISIVLGCDTKKNRTIDSVGLLNYGFNTFKSVNLGDYIRKTICINVDKSEGVLYTLKRDADIYYPLKEEEIKEIRVNYNVVNNLVAPLNKGYKVASASIFLNNSKICEVEYLLPQKIERKDWKEFFKELLFNNIENMHI